MQQFGRYQLLEHLASGGMADVYRAQVPGAAGFLKEVAIKVIRPGFSDRSDFIQMFIQEARLASKLSHANIVQVFDFDQVDGLDIWLGARVKNEEATAAFLHLGDIPPDQRTRTLQEASRKAGIADSDCPMALLDESWSGDGFRRLLKEGKATPGQ